MVGNPRISGPHGLLASALLALGGCVSSPVEAPTTPSALPEPAVAESADRPALPPAPREEGLYAPAPPPAPVAPPPAPG